MDIFYLTWDYNANGSTKLYKGGLGVPVNNLFCGGGKRGKYRLSHVNMYET